MINEIRYFFMVTLIRLAADPFWPSGWRRRAARAVLARMYR